jgi:hypothetical protein
MAWQRQRAGWVAFGLVVALALACGTAGAQNLPLDGGLLSNQGAAETFNPSSDPLGDVDTYLSLSRADVEGQWSKDDGRNVTQKLEELRTFGSVVHVDVKLVGFDGDGNYGLKVDEADFLRYFEMVLEEHEKEAMVLNVREGTSHVLPIRRKFFFRVVKAKKELNEDVSSRIRSWLLTSGKDAEASVRHTVPVSIVDDVIGKDYRDSDLSQVHTIYLLNPKRVIAPPRKKPEAGSPTAAGASGGDPAKAGKDNDALPNFREGGKDTGNPHDKWTAGVEPEDEPEVLSYEYDPTEKQDRPDSDADKAGKTLGRERRPCGSTMWAGQQRYMWIDLTAGPLLYGPHTSGEGLVSEFSIPRLDNFMVDSEEGHGGHHFAYIQEFLAEVVSLVGKTADLLIEPSLHHFPVPLAKVHFFLLLYMYIYTYVYTYIYECMYVCIYVCMYTHTQTHTYTHTHTHTRTQTLRLHLVHITNEAGIKTQYADEHGFIAGMPHVPAWNTIKDQLGHRGGNVVVQGQNIMYNRSVVQMNECKLCLAAYAAALRRCVSRISFGGSFASH